MQYLNTLFDLSNSLAFLAWALMIFTPRWRYTQYLVRWMVLPAVFALMYTVALPFVLDLSIADLSTLDKLQVAFQQKEVLLLGWLHYLAFDLLVGCWVYQRCMRREVSAWLRIPSLVFTFVTGPLGFLLFIVAHLIRYKRWPGLEL
ncbi:ABA4-like family protein [Marinoscillum furvescens]|uniref:Uncharacterized protein DUF4281 n=1 Tax=Marinoscillum furvescens DSM 4134 TaxID=1122208 RepID=A0A3D9KZ07_MARFU|nr:ABA4-like family protein [Marinoscillum furvescens]RED94113.1 uncharacterized protein DUF4281 [Marinoscillum furvescens DSM 4134]